jgi:hypothetical protein
MPFESVISPRPSDERGTVLLCTLMVTALMATLVGVLVMVITTDTLIGANHRTAQSLQYAAAAVMERALGALANLPDWTVVPAVDVGVPATLNDGAIGPRVPGGPALDLARLTAEQQAASDARFPMSADRPIWRLFAHAPLASVIPGESASTAAYLVVWLADDVEDGDGNPAADSNRVLLMRAEAFGTRGARRRVEATLARDAPPAVEPPPEGAAVAARGHIRVLAWREDP